MASDAIRERQQNSNGCSATASHQMNTGSFLVDSRLRYQDAESPPVKRSRIFKTCNALANFGFEISGKSATEHDHPRQAVISRKSRGKKF